MNEQEALIRKWLNESLSPEEQQQFDSLEANDFYKRIVRDAAAFRPETEVPLPDWSEIRTRKTPGTRVVPLNWKSLTAAAAVVCLGVLMYWLWQGQDLVVHQAGTAEHISAILPDGSSILLNAESTLSYSKKRWKDAREVQLDGEAIFQVNKGKDFSVVTPKGRVVVLGTIFNIKSRPALFEVFCQEGSVLVNAAGQSDTLQAGEAVRMKEIGLQRIPLRSRALPWSAERSVFVQTRLIEVIEELSRQYGIRVSLDEEVDPTVLFSGAFAHGDLSLALQSITEPLGLSFEIRDSGQIRITR